MENGKQEGKLPVMMPDEKADFRYEISYKIRSLLGMYLDGNIDDFVFVFKSERDGSEEKEWLLTLNEVKKDVECRDY